MVSVHGLASAADSHGMRRGEAFADVLERELHRAPWPVEGRATAARAANRPISTNPFLFLNYESAPAAGGALRPPLQPGAAARVAPPAPVPAPVALAPVRRLSAREEGALRGLVALGADLDAQFTAEQLRRAFRILARRYHPDGHPDIDAPAKARLSRTFADLADHHRCLLAVVEPREQDLNS